MNIKVLKILAALGMIGGGAVGLFYDFISEKLEEKQIEETCKEYNENLTKEQINECVIENLKSAGIIVENDTES